jgi:glycine/D-amino acid oxidase-like deaminating enzyme
VTHRSADIVICGAGIAGISAAYHLSVRRGLRNILLVDSGAPLSLTSDKSMECYRNWYPGPGDHMVSLVNRSIDIMEEIERATDYNFHLNRRGYAFATARQEEAERLQYEAEAESLLGVGSLRIHNGAASVSAYRPAPATGFEDQPIGADLLLDKKLIQRHFPHLSDATVAVLHARRCGWFSAQQYGMYMLEQARAHGVELLSGEVTAVTTNASAVSGVDISTEEQTLHVATKCFLSASGPLQKQVGRLLGIELPISCELHLKAVFRDPLGVIPRDSPMVIWMDSGPLRWTDEERTELAEDAQTQHLLESFPGGVHGRPEGGGDAIILQWTHDISETEPVFPLSIDPYYSEMLLRSMAVAMPAMEAYFTRSTKPFIDGGYYAKTPENRPLAGPLPVKGAFIIGAMSGFGMQSSSALGELVSLHIAGEALPHYAPSFLLDRYDDASYLAALDSVDPRAGQI